MGTSRSMTSTIWTFGGGAAAADTFLFPHPTSNRSVQTNTPRTHGVTAKSRELVRSLPLLAPPTCIKELTLELETCHWLGMALLPLGWILSTKGAQTDGGAPNQTPHPEKMVQ